MRRIVVLGNVGGGKTVLAHKLGDLLDIAAVEIDLFLQRAGTNPKSLEDFEQFLSETLQNDQWIIDGFASWPTLEKTLEKADSVIFIDLPLWRHIWHLMKRHVNSAFRPPAGYPADYPFFAISFQMYRMLMVIHVHSRPRFLKMLEAQANSSEVFHLRSTGEIGSFLEMVKERNETTAEHG